ncbi:MAG TPA: hypothetical protein GX012_04625 [Acholeplasma sp.]|nr:hypothetical protein [Acholeplasma sp.]
MKNLDKKINIRILKLISFISLLLPILIIARFLLGYRMIIYIDLVLSITLYILLMTVWFQKRKRYSIYKWALIIFIIILISGILLPGLEYLGFTKTLYADVLYLVPGLIFASFYIYYYKKGYVNLSD